MRANARETVAFLGLCVHKFLPRSVACAPRDHVRASAFSIVALFVRVWKAIRFIVGFRVNHC